MRIMILCACLFSALGCSLAPRSGDLAPDRDFPCPAVTWDDGGGDVGAEDAVMWSAAVDMLSDQAAVRTPCGDAETSCAKVSQYVRSLGGRVLRNETCAVVWIPEGA